jgi:hypothetical protein
MYKDLVVIYFAFPLGANSIEVHLENDTVGDVSEKMHISVTLYNQYYSPKDLVPSFI